MIRRIITTKEYLDMKANYIISLQIFTIFNLVIYNIRNIILWGLNSGTDKSNIIKSFAHRKTRYKGNGK